LDGSERGKKFLFFERKKAPLYAEKENKPASQKNKGGALLLVGERVLFFNLSYW